MLIPEALRKFTVRWICNSFWLTRELWIANGRVVWRKLTSWPIKCCKGGDDNCPWSVSSSQFITELSPRWEELVAFSSSRMLRMSARSCSQSFTAVWLAGVNAAVLVFRSLRFLILSDTIIKCHSKIWTLWRDFADQSSHGWFDFYNNVKSFCTSNWGSQHSCKIANDGQRRKSTIITSSLYTWSQQLSTNELARFSALIILWKLAKRVETVQLSILSHLSIRSSLYYRVSLGDDKIKATTKTSC